MCGRFQTLSRALVQDIAEQLCDQAPLHLMGEPEKAGTHDAYPKDLILAIDSAFNVAELAWGFDVEWTSNPVFNTRIESIADGSRMWQNANEHGRCIIPVARFYEPHMHERVRSMSTGNAVKRPYLFGMRDGEPLLLAGISEDGRCSIVTTRPNPSIADVHNRMPLVLRPDEVRSWFDGELLGFADRSEIEFDVAPADDRPCIVESEQLGLF